MSVPTIHRAMCSTFARTAARPWQTFSNMSGLLYSRNQCNRWCTCCSKDTAVINAIGGVLVTNHALHYIFQSSALGGVTCAINHMRCTTYLTCAINHALHYILASSALCGVAFVTNHALHYILYTRSCRRHFYDVQRYISQPILSTSLLDYIQYALVSSVVKSSYVKSNMEHD